VILRAYKTELDPTVEQRRALARHVAGARVAHNWVLERWRVLAGLPRLVAFLRALSGLTDDAGARAAWHIGFGFHAFLHGERRETKKPSRKKQEGKTVYTTKVKFAAKAPPGPIPDRSPDSDWIHAQLTEEKNTIESPVAWLTELSAFAVREGAGDVGRGYAAYFRRLKKHRQGDHSECKPKGKRCQLGEPQFRSARERRYHADQPNPIRITSRTVLIPGVGNVRLKERDYIPVTQAKSHHFIHGGKVCGVGISERDGRWYVSVRAEVPKPPPQPRGPGRVLRERPTPRIEGRKIGVENGVRVLVATFDGDSTDSFVDSGLRDDVRIKRFVRQRKLWERRMARRWREGVAKRDQSAGWHEAKRRVRHYHARVVDLRDDRVGKAVRKIVDTGAEVALLREPHVADLLNRETAPDPAVRNKLAPDVHGARMGDVRRRLEYKMAWAGGKVEQVDRFEPVTKRCSACGVVRDTSPSYPNFKCRACGHTEDRDDMNAPKNLFGYDSSGSLSSGEAGPRSVGSKTPETSGGRGHNGREKRSVRPTGQPVGTAPYRSGNLARPGALHTVQPFGSFHEVDNERCSDATIPIEQTPLVTAVQEPTIRDLSQTDSQPTNFVGRVPDESEAAS
jgi:transposase